ncbi:MAG: family 20 glycosylhydrolase [Acidobacteria bacterium]|nr:family 20 glycosylhydrolase [Acidobacteriota bacterium]
MTLWPPPRRVEQPGADPPLVVPEGAAVGLEITTPVALADRSAGGEELTFAVAGLRRALASVPWSLAVQDEGGSATGNGADVACRIVLDSTPSGHPEGGRTGEPRVLVPTDESYRLRIDRDGIAIQAATTTGLFRAAATLRQWIASEGRQTDSGLEVPAVEIEDQPDFGVRGAMLDVSRNRVPTMAYLERLIDRLAEWKVNHLQLYVEHTYAYADHEEVWRDASPFTAEEIRRLDAFCRERFIELTPNQNSFGHFHRWLVHDRYRPLAEVPEGFRHPFSIDPEPFSLCATDPRVLDLLTGLYDELLPQFGSRRFNVGLDETFDLGRGRSAEACEERGKPAVYLDFLRQVHGLVTERDRQMLFWGDIILEHPEVIDRIPEDAVALCWGYEADHPFADQCARLAASGRPFWVCPGTSSWNSFGGRLRNAIGNLALAATAGRDAGAQGFLITDWGDHGHLQPHPIAELPLSIGAGFAWSVDAAREAGSGPERNEEAWLDHASRFVYDGDETLARTVVDLGAIDLKCGGPVMNGTTLFYLLRFIDDDLTHRRFRRLSIARLQRTYARLASARERLIPGSSESSHTALDWTSRMMMWCCQLGVARLTAGRGGQLDELAPSVRANLAADLRRIADDLPDVWLPTSREGGLRLSQDLLFRAATLLATP